MSQRCAGCSQESPDGAKFCLECGSAFGRSCPTCGHPATAGKFCMECGAALSAPADHRPGAPAPVAKQPGGPISERRTTTVLFGDLVAFTTLSETRDPEEVRELLSAYFAVARTVVGRYGGTIEKFIGDAVMAVWGVPVSHEDDAERAVRAGLDLVAEVIALGERVGAPQLSMRVGITTGSVAVTLGAVNEGMVAGDAVNTAARVQTAASPGNVWVDQETRGLTAAAVAFTDMGEHDMKGKELPARLFRADAIVAAVGGAQRVDGLEAPMAGREVEMRRVREAFHATEEDGRSRIVIVSGQPGVGKSRLGWEFEKYADGLQDPLRWHRGRCLSYGDGVAYWAFADMMRARLGIQEADDRATIDAKIRQGVETFAAGEATWLAPRMAALLTGEGGFDRTDLFAAWTTFLDRLSGDEPLVLLFEDTQHADSGLLDLIEHLLEASRARLYVLVLTRPELLDRRPALATGKRATVVELQLLPDAAMATVVDGLVAELPADARAAIVGRAEGVPLYAVETVRSLIDRDAVVARDGRYVFVDHDHTLVDLDQLRAPTSLQTLIAARLDILTPTERRVVQDASLFGMSFRQSSLLALSDMNAYELEATLAALVRKDVFEQATDLRGAEPGHYRFLQALVREVAYETVARKDRKARHLAVAAHLEQEADAAAAAGIVALHLRDAWNVSSTNDPDRDEIAARARDWLVRAAERAESLGSSDEAMTCLLSALELPAAPRERAELLERAGRAAFLAGFPARAEELGSQAVHTYESLDLPPALARSLLVQGKAVMALGRNEDATELINRAHDLAQAHPDVEPATKLQLLSALATLTRVRGDLAAQMNWATQQMRLAEELADPAEIVSALNGLAIVLFDEGSPSAYFALLERCVSIARENRLLDHLGRSLSNLNSEAYADDLVQAALLAEESIAVQRQVGNAAYLDLAIANAGFTWWLKGDWDLVVENVGGWLDEQEATSFSCSLELARLLVAQARGEVRSPFVPIESDSLYEVHTTELVKALHQSAAQGSVLSVAEVAASSRALVRDAENLEDFEILWSTTVELHLTAGELEEAAQLLTLADAMPGGRSRRLTRGERARLTGLLALARGEDPEADLRAAEEIYAEYGAPFLLARTRLSLGQWLHAQERALEAESLLREARDAFDQLRAVPWVEAVDAITSQVLLER